MVTAYQEAKAHAFASFALWQEPMDTIGLFRELEFASRGKGWKAPKSIGPFGNRGDVRGTQKSQGERKREREENGAEVFLAGKPPRGCIISSQNADTSPAPYRNRPSSDSGNRVFPMGLRKSAVCGILTGAKHGSVFPGGLTNWNLTGRQNVSLRTSAHAGVAISIEFRGQERHTP